MPPRERFIRARPLLGTRVDIRIGGPSGIGPSGIGMSAAAANAAIDSGFSIIAGIHRLMSFHEAGSDVSRLNRDAVSGAVPVDPRTFEVLRRAQEISQALAGVFDICAARGLRSDHGVIIPKANIVTLMLRDDVVEAVRKGLFAVYAVETVDEAIAVLTGMPAGARRRDGSFARKSFNRRVQERLLDFARPRVLKPVHLDGWWRF